MAFCRDKNQKLLFKVDSKLKFRMWFKYGLKAQKLLAQGIALGIMAISNAPCPYRATGYRPKQPRAMPWAKSFCPFRACGAYMRNFNKK